MLLHERFNNPQAADLFREALAKEPSNGEAYLGLAIVSADGFDGKATEYAAKAIELDPKLVGAHELMANLALQNDKNDLAIAEADKALTLDKDAMDAMAIHAAAEVLADRSPDAWFAKIEAINAGCEEAILLNAEGFVSECTGDNLFIVKEQHLFTPPLYAGALYGITRRVVMEMAEESGLEVTETNLTRYDLFNADECFLTGTGAEIVPVVKIDGRVIADGKPGPATERLITQYRALTKVSGEPIYQ